jgi:hypothetical protein
MYFRRVHRQGIRTLALIAVALMVPAAAFAKPSKSSLDRPPLGVTAGQSFPFSDGSRPPARLLLSRDRRADPHDVKLRLNTRAKPWTATAPRTTKAGAYHLVACAKSGRCRSSAKTIQVIRPPGKPRPVNAIPVLEPDRAASATMTPDGGTLTATAADGSVFTLVLAKGALLDSREIKMTPVASAGGLPFKGYMAGVQLEPDGTTFHAPVTLTITPAASIPLQSLVPLIWDAGGRNARLEPFSVDGNAAVFSLLHFSSRAVTTGLSADIFKFGTRPLTRADWARQNFARLDREYRVDVGRRINGRSWDATLSALRVSLYIIGNEVVRGDIRAAAADPGNDDLRETAVRSLVEWENDITLKYVPDAQLSALREELRALLEQVLRRASDLAFQRCQAGDASQAPRLVMLERETALLQFETDYAATIERFQKCAHFELAFDSEVSTTYNAGGGFSWHVTGTVPLTARLPGEEPSQVEGTPLEYQSFTGHVSSNCGARDPGSAPVAPVTLKATLLNIDLSAPPGAPAGVSLIVDPGKPLERYVDTGCNNGTVTNDYDLWHTAFERLHLGERTGFGDETSFTFTDFTRGTALLFARKEYTGSAADDNCQCTDTEHTTIDLRHRPLP